MNTFTCLLIGHLLGDWVLQNDWMANGKRRGVLTWAGMVHVTIYTAIASGAFWLSGGTNGHLAPFFILGAVIFVSHWLIDTTSVAERWMRLYRQSDLEIVRVMVDQTFHLVILFLLSVVSVPGS